MPHQVQLTDSQWETLQHITGRRNPASVVRDVVDQFIRSRLVSGGQPQPVAKTPVTEPSPAFQARWVALGVDIKWHDKFLKKAFAWYVSNYGSEQAALEDLEYRHAHENLRNPNLWMIRAYRDFLEGDEGSPG